MSQVTVQLTISDVNDNAPQFSQGVYTAEVPEFLAVGASALKVFANDPDVGSNGEVVYAVSTNNRFTIHPDSGEITSTGPLDHETQDRFTFIVWVSGVCVCVGEWCVWGVCVCVGEWCVCVCVGG